MCWQYLQDCELSPLQDGFGVTQGQMKLPKPVTHGRRSRAPQAGTLPPQQQSHQHPFSKHDAFGRVQKLAQQNPVQQAAQERDAVRRTDKHRQKQGSLPFAAGAALAPVVFLVARRLRAEKRWSVTADAGSDISFGQAQSSEADAAVHADEQSAAQAAAHLAPRAGPASAVGTTLQSFAADATPDDTHTSTAGTADAQAEAQQAWPRPASNQAGVDIAVRSSFHNNLELAAGPAAPLQSKATTHRGTSSTGTQDTNNQTAAFESAGLQGASLSAFLLQMFIGHCMLHLRHLVSHWITANRFYNSMFSPCSWAQLLTER